MFHAGSCIHHFIVQGASIIIPLSWWLPSACSQMPLPSIHGEGLRKEAFFKLNSNAGRIGSLSFALDGRRLLIGSDDGTVRVWDVQSGKWLYTSPKEGARVKWLGYKSSGEIIVTVGEAGQFHAWRVCSLRQAWDGPKKAEGAILGATSCGPGDYIATLDTRSRISVWDASTGRRSLAFHAQGRSNSIAGARHGRAIAVAEPLLVRIYSCLSGQELYSLVDDSKSVQSIAISADGRLLAVAYGWRGSDVGIYETFSARKVRTCYIGLHAEDAVSRLCFARGGRFLAVGTISGKLILSDLSLGKEICQSDCQGGEIVALVCSPDGQYLASGSANGAGLVWSLPQCGRGAFESRRPEDVLFSLRLSARMNGLPPGIWLWNNLYEFAPRSIPMPDTLEERDLERLWNDLNVDDASRALKAVWDLQLYPKQALAYLLGRLQRVGSADKARISECISNLADDRFEVRRAATKQLDELGELAVEQLRRRLAENPGAEEKRRIEELILKTRICPKARLRDLRAIQIVEYIGTRQSKSILEELAKGAPESVITQESKASLERLNGRDERGRKRGRE